MCSARPPGPVVSLGPGFQGDLYGPGEFVRAGCSQVGPVTLWNGLENAFWLMLPEVRSGAGRLAHVAVTNSSVRLSAPWPPFKPCAVIALYGQDKTLDLDGRVSVRHGRTGASGSSWTRIRSIAPFSGSERRIGPRLRRRPLASSPWLAANPDGHHQAESGAVLLYPSCSCASCYCSPSSIRVHPRLYARAVFLWVSVAW